MSPSPTPTTGPPGTYYCNWQNCNGLVQGGPWCNESRERCVTGCGGMKDFVWYYFCMYSFSINLWIIIRRYLVRQWCFSWHPFTNDGSSFTFSNALGNDCFTYNASSYATSKYPTTDTSSDTEWRRKMLHSELSTVLDWLVWPKWE